jgi:hypothetical protein
LLEVPRLFKASELGSDALFLDEMHPTAAGHRLIGEGLAEILGGWAGGESLSSKGTDGDIPLYQDTFVFGTGTGKAPGTGTGKAPGPATPPPRTGIRGPSLVIEGVVEWPGHGGGVLQIDAVVQSENGEAQVVGTTRIDSPGPFRMVVRKGAERVGFVVTEASGADGPDADEQRFELDGQTWNVPSGGLKGVRLSLTPQHGGR